MSTLPFCTMVTPPNAWLNFSATVSFSLLWGSTFFNLESVPSLLHSLIRTYHAFTESLELDHIRCQHSLFIVLYRFWMILNQIQTILFGQHFCQRVSIVLISREHTASMTMAMLRSRAFKMISLAVSCINLSRDNPGPTTRTWSRENTFVIRSTMLWDVSLDLTCPLSELCQILYHKRGVVILCCTHVRMDNKIYATCQYCLQ